MIQRTLFIVLLAASCSKKDPPLPPGATEVHIAVDDKGYTPAEVKAPKGKPVRLIFTRTKDDGCGQQLVFPKQNIRKDLPLKEPVSVDLTMPESGKITFACGMDMYQGAVVAE